MKERQCNVLIVVSGPSGVGKGTVLKRVMQLHPAMCESVSCTTRAPRGGEREGESYFFVSRARFEEMIERGELLEYSQHFENYYGTPRAFVESRLKECDVLLEIDVDGALNIKKAYPKAVLVMIAPPDMASLEERLKKRGTESGDSAARRLARADYELSKIDSYDYVVVNDEVERAAQEICGIICKEKEALYDK